MIDYSKVLIYNFPGTSWTLEGEDYEGLDWLDNSSKPTKKTLDDLWVKTLEAEKSAIFEKEKAKNDLLQRLGISEDEAKLLIG